MSNIGFVIGEGNLHRLLFLIFDRLAIHNKTRRETILEIKQTYALITGANRGLGKAIATALAEKAYNLLLVARSDEELAELSENLIKLYGIKVNFLAADLSLSSTPAQVLSWVESNHFQVSILINNAGYGIWGEFSSLPLSNQLEMCQLNMETVVSLCYLFKPLLLKSAPSYILNVSSTAAYQAVPTFALYAASKSFILSFSRAIRFELKKTNISVSCISPGPIDTGFAGRAGLDPFSKMAKKFNMNPEEVARIAINGMFAKKAEIIPGIVNIISAYATRWLPKAFIEKTAAGIYKD
ncbi:SDR family NAD(P)-dependent oxidoreductase [Pedobacter terrae]|uniref:SDR family NAD(P)-dependent oxidoreductase n=1 Tax=Pedobacter terrae TaxID=405671 RepID=UPI002FF5AD56